ncbi:MAG: SDR family oxidoreductase [Myxococcota bacterium]
MSIYGWFTGRGQTGFGYNSTAEEVTDGLDLSGKTYLVTGCNSGLGLETSRVLALRGGRIIGLARTEDKARTALASIPGHDHVPVACELSDPASVYDAAESIAATGVTIDALIANAGIMALPELKQAHGYELQFFTNHIGHAQLVEGLIDWLADDGRVVMLSSGAHRNAPAAGIEFDNLSGDRNYSAWTAYGQSKLANLLYAKQLATRFEGSDRTANAVHPGVIWTNLGRHMPGLVSLIVPIARAAFMKTVEQGAATQVYVATHPDAARISGEYWDDCNPGSASPQGRDQALAARLQERTEAILAEISPESAPG